MTNPSRQPGSLILVMSSSNLSNDINKLKNYINTNNFQNLTFWWFATPKGAPMLSENGSFHKNSKGEVDLSLLQQDYIKNISSSSSSQIFSQIRP